MRRAGEAQEDFFTSDINKPAATFLRKENLCVDESTEDDNDLANGSGL